MFPGRDEIKYTDPDKDPSMKKISKDTMSKFSSALSAWKVRVKYRIVNKKEPYSKIVKDNPTITAEHFQIFKALARPKLPKKSLST